MCVLGQIRYSLNPLDLWRPRFITIFAGPIRPSIGRPSPRNRMPVTWLEKSRSRTRAMSISLSFWSLFCGTAYWTSLQAMDEPLPQRPTLFFDLVLPSRSKHLFLNFWIADTHVATPSNHAVLQRGIERKQVTEVKTARRNPNPLHRAYRLVVGCSLTPNA